MGPLVLVVDDDLAVRRALVRLLRSAGLNVEAFASGSELLAFEGPLCASCLVLDLHLPDMTGLEILRLLRTSAPDLPVLVLTGETGLGVREQALRDGARAFLAKPFEEDRLLDEVRRLTAPEDRRRPPDPLSLWC